MYQDMVGVAASCLSLRLNAAKGYPAEIGHKRLSQMLISLQIILSLESS